MATIPDYQLLFQSVPGLYLVLAPDFTIVTASDAYVNATKTRRHEIVGRGLFEVFPDNPEDPSATGTRNLRASIERVLATGKPDRMAVQKYDIRRPESEGGGFEERFWSPVNSPIAGPSGEIKYILHRAEDVTEFVRLKDDGAQQLQAQKLESLGRLASGIAHDFNNLLTVIMSDGYMLADELPVADPRQDRIKHILEASQRAAALTGQLLAFARKQVMTTRIVDIGDVVHRAEPLLRRLIREDITFVIHTEPAAAAVEPGQIEQVLINLAVNARDAMSRGGVLTITVASDSLGNGHRPAGLAAGDYVCMAVRDTGVGMSDEVRSHVFEPFFTTKEFGRGTGLGLAMCHGIVAQFGGAISVESAPGKGSTFRVYLPLASVAPQSPKPAPARATPSRANATILLAEDEPLVRHVLVSTLERRGYTVLEASDGEQAIRRARAHPGQIDLLISDALMPHMSGPDLARRLQELKPGIRVIFISGYTEETLPLSSASDSSLNFLPKPFLPEVLVERVAQVLSGKGPEAPAS